MEQFLIGSSVFLWVIVVFNLFLTLALIRRLNTKSQISDLSSGLKKGELAPNFEAETLSGTKINLSTFANQAVTFIFVSPNCQPCREALPTYESLYSKAKLLEIKLVLVVSSDIIRTQAFVNELNINLPVIVAPRETNTFLEDYNVRGTPSYCLIDETGTAQSAGFASSNSADWNGIVTSWKERISILEVSS